MFANIKIGVRLAAGFAAVLLLLVVLAMVGLNGMSTLDTKVDEIVTDNMHRTKLINDMSEAVHVVSRVTRTIILLEDHEAMAVERRKLDSAREKYNEALTALEKTQDSDKGKAVRAKIKQLSAETRGLNNKVVELAEADNDKEALKLLISSAGPATQKWQDLLDEYLTVMEEENRGDYDIAQQAYASAHTLMLSVAGIALAVGALIAWLLTRSITRPTNQLIASADKMAVGDFNFKIDIHSADELGQLANSVRAFQTAVQTLAADANMLAGAAVAGKLETRADASKHQGDFRKIVEGVNNTLDGVILPINEVATVLTGLEQGDLTNTVKGDYKGQLSDFKNTVNNMVAKLSQVVIEVNEGAQALASASEEVSATAQGLSQAASEQAAGVEETSSSLEQMTSSIAQNTENAKVTESMSSKAAQDATEGGESVNATVAAMKQIAKKISIIDDIAAQTNLLALNAAIEAARAGEHGKGFAVVAAEVRKLAERSQVAAQEIGEVATSSVDLAEKAGKLLEHMVPAIRKTADLVQEIAAASSEQSSGVGQINSAMNQLNQTTQQNASSSEELAATSEEMSSQAEQLQKTMSFFRLDSSGQGGGGFAVRKSTASSRKPVQAKATASAKPSLKAMQSASSDVDEAQFTKF
jgi:methyl-accepting chemotaxis protein